MYFICIKSIENPCCIRVYLENLAKDLQFSGCVRRVRDFGVKTGAALQHWFHVLEDTNARFAVVTAHTAFADSSEGKVGTREVKKGSVHGDSACSGAIENSVDD